MKYFSTFSGIGGFELGIINAHGNLEHRHKKREDTEVLQRDGSDTQSDELQGTPTCVGYSEIDKYAVQIYQKHFPEHKNYGDITTLNADTLPDFDLLVGGFPCQAFSIAGKRKGFNDTRGTLFFDLARILRAKRPRLFVFENVKGLLSHDNGATFRTIIATITELGYDCQWQVLNSKNHGVPQNRERVLIVGHLRGTPRPEVFPFLGEDTANTSFSFTTEQTTKGIATRHLDRNGGLISEIASTVQVIEFVGSLNPVTRKGTEHQAHLSRAHKQPARVHDSRGINPALSSGETQGRYHTLTPDMQIRRLTPTECERLQGFPDGWTEGVSDTQRYKTLGNAVTTNVVQAVVENMMA